MRIWSGLHGTQARTGPRRIRDEEGAVRNQGAGVSRRPSPAGTLVVALETLAPDPRAVAADVAQRVAGGNAAQAVAEAVDLVEARRDHAAAQWIDEPVTLAHLARRGQPLGVGIDLVPLVRPEHPPAGAAHQPGGGADAAHREAVVDHQELVVVVFAPAS